MEIQLKKEAAALCVALKGRLDTVTAPDLEAALNGALAGVGQLSFDLTDLEYMSSAGLRVLLTAQKTMNKQGSMIVTGVNDTIREIFDLTGFSDILTIQ